jgi:sensor histidine kinase regulating citrate/malate metabolism
MMGMKMAHGGGFTNITDLNGTNIMSWDMSNTRVGIGTVTPAYKLDVIGSARIGQTSNNSTSTSLQLHLEVMVMMLLLILVIGILLTPEYGM